MLALDRSFSVRLRVRRGVGFRRLPAPKCGQGDPWDRVQGLSWSVVPDPSEGGVRRHAGGA
eukprot:7394203-Prorocentrum_lima.AAC.1